MDNSPTTGEYVTKHNSQKENTPAVIYSIGDKRRLNWKSRYISNNMKGRKVWKESNDDRMSFELESDTMTIIHPRDGNPLSEKITYRGNNICMVESIYLVKNSVWEWYLEW